MKSIYMNFAQQADQTIIDAGSRSKIIAMAVAVALSNANHIPSSEVGNVNEYFNTQVLPKIRMMIGEFNENVVFDAAGAVEYTKTFWMLRYTAAHPVSSPIYNYDCSFFEAMMGVGTFVSSDTNVFCEKFKVAILALSTSAAIIFAEMEVANG